MILNFNEVLNYVNSNSKNIDDDNSNFDLYCGAIILNDYYYRDYPIVNEKIEKVITPTKNNIQEFYQIQDFQKIAGNKIKYIIPRNSLLENSAIVIKNNIVDNTKSYANFYNPIIAYDTLKDMIITDDICIVAKNPKEYTNEDNLFISICSSNLNNKFCNNMDIENFDSSLVNGNQLKTWKELFIPNYSANLTYDILVLVLYKDNNGKFKIKEQFKIDKRLTEYESSYIYVKLNKYTTDLSNTNINNNRFTNTTINSKLYNSVNESDIIRAINILEDDNSVISLMSFEYDNKIDLVNFISNKIVFNSLYDAKRYINDDNNSILDNIKNDFLIEDDNEYFSLCLSRKDCINTLNMYLKKCEYINSYIYVNCNGINAGLVFKNNLINLIDYDSFKVNDKDLKLLFYPTESQRVYLYENNCNTMFRKNKTIYINTNKITNEKISQIIINQNIICKIIVKMLADVKDKYKLTEKNFYITIKRIYSDIENIFKLFYKQITATTLQMLRTENNGEITNNLLITIYFNDFIEEFEVNLIVEEK